MFCFVLFCFSFQGKLTTILLKFLKIFPPECWLCNLLFELYIEECISSIKNQTLKEVEIICINDGSTDNSLAIIKRLAENGALKFVVENEQDNMDWIHKAIKELESFDGKDSNGAKNKHDDIVDAFSCGANYFKLNEHIAPLSFIVHL